MEARGSRGALEVYKRICSRVGQQPAQEVCLHLGAQGALVADLQLCRSVQALLIFLREAPAGICQISLYNGALFYGQDIAYREQLRILQKCAPGDTLAQEQLWQLVAALASFCSSRGDGLLSLELTGLPLGRQGSNLAPSLSRCLRGAPSLQRLCLAGCSLRDQGLLALLPHLASGLPRLSRLSLARNGLRDARLVGRLLRTRAAAQGRRRAITLDILDLSGNPNLGAAKIAAPPAERWGGEPPATREQLLRVICACLRAGLRIRVLRLRNLRLRREDLRPLLRLLVEQATPSGRSAASIGEGSCPPPDGGPGPIAPGPDCGIDLLLEEVSLEGNPLEDEFPDAIAQALAELRAPPPRAFGMVDGRRFVSSELASDRSAGSAPLGEHTDRRLRGHAASAGSVLPERNALSEGEAEDLGRELLGGNRLRMDCELLAGRMDARSVAKSPYVGAVRPLPLQAGRMEMEPPEESDGDESADQHYVLGQRGIPLDDIPDLGAKCGFAPPVRLSAALAVDSSGSDRSGSSQQESESDEDRADGELLRALY